MPQDQLPDDEREEDDREAVIRVRQLEVGFGERLVMKKLDLDVYRGEILGFVGPSGQQESVLTRDICRAPATTRPIATQMTTASATEPSRPALSRPS